MPQHTPALARIPGKPRIRIHPPSQAIAGTVVVRRPAPPPPLPRPAPVVFRDWAEI